MRYTWKNGEDEALFRIINCICGNKMSDWKGPALMQALKLYRDQNNDKQIKIWLVLKNIFRVTGTALLIAHLLS